MIFYKTIPLAENTWQINEFGFDAMYYLEGEKSGILIDTGVGAGDFRGVLNEISTKPFIVAATHGHLDHMGGVYLFDKIYASNQAYRLFKGCTDHIRRMYINELQNISEGFSSNETTDFLIRSDKMPEHIAIDSTSVIDLGGRTVTVFETPGHTTGCLSFLDSKTGFLFSGDAIMSRLLFADDDADKMERLHLWHSSITKVLHGNTKIKAVYAGHFGRLPSSAIKELLSLAEGIQDGSIVIDVDEEGSTSASLGRAKIRFGWPSYTVLYST
ncbi:MAG: MBL fold metallo-hydrolase [Clostridiales bacterium]|nr:MBL fold metallo-hydrolase [Clostridiales bacterium]